MAKLLCHANPEDGAHASLIHGVTLLRAARRCRPVPVLYEPCIVIVAQGRKRFHLPDHVLTYSARNYLVVTVPVPADCETEVGAEGPFLGIAVRIDLNTLNELVLQLGEPAHGVPSSLPSSCTNAHTPLLSLAISDAAVRLCECLTYANDAKVLGPQLVRELLYRVLCEDAGHALRNLLFGSEHRAHIHRILEGMHLHYAAPFDLSTLAHRVGMSTSALHLHFRAVTGTSPVQYLKTLRLHKARMLMVQSSLNAAVAAERVGYASPSQFSREFKRLFGTSPADEAQRVRAAFGFTDEVSATS